MKPTQEQVLDWANQVWGTDLGKPWSQTALLHITELATLAYEAGCKEILCGCGDQIMPDDGAECGNCVTARNA